MKKLSTRVYEHLILPIITNVSPVRQVSWGVAVGVFIGLTPTVGIQMYLVAAIWGICRYLFRVRFALSVGVAMVWISNPITMVPIYYIGFITGSFFFNMIGLPIISLDLQAFQQKFEDFLQHSGWEMISESSQFFLVDLGVPTLVGSLFYAIPFAIICYFLTHVLLTRYRKFKAEQENLTYEEWCLRYEVSN